MRDAVLDLLGSLAGSVDGSGGIRGFKLNFLDNSVDHDSYDHKQQLLILVKTNIEIERRWIGSNTF